MHVAQQVSATAAPKWDRNGDVSMGAVPQYASSRSAKAQESSLLWHLQGERAKLAAGGDWDGVNVVNGAIMALAKGKGTGKAAAKGDPKAKGMSPKSAGKGRDWFDGTCYHCGAYDHRKAQGKQFDVEMAAKGKGYKGKGKGKGMGLYHEGTNEEDETEHTMDCQDKEGAAE